MSSEDYETYRALRTHRSGEKAALRLQAEADFAEASKLAGDNGFVLRRFNEQHYQLSRSNDALWRVNFYPGNRRIYSDPNSTNRMLKLRDRHDEWNLITFVESAIRSLEVSEQ